MKHFYQAVPGWFVAEDVYMDAVRHAPDGAHFVEVGAWKGKSTSFMGVEIANSGKKIKFDCIDNWQGSKNRDELQQNDSDVKKGTLFEVFKKNITPVAGFVKPIVGDRTASASLYADKSLDFIYIDAAHDYESVKRDILAWLPKLKDDGLMTGDDFNEAWPGVMKAVQEIFGNDFSVWTPTWVVDRRKNKKPKTYDIILRTCSKTSMRKGERVVGADKTEIIVRCLHSLITAINNVVRVRLSSIRLTVIDDHSSPECINKIQNILATCACDTKLIHLESSGNRASVRACFEYARDRGAEVIYFVEDDYLHFPSALAEMIEAYESFSKNLAGREVALFPVDYPDRYAPAGIYESRIVLGARRHWRTVKHSTATFLSSRTGVFKNWEIYEKIWNGQSEFINEDETFNQVWQNNATLFSPIPSLAFHLQFPENLPPFAEWEEVWGECKFFSPL